MFTCPYCEKEFKIESRFLSHQCKEKTRFEMSKTIHGIRGYHYFVKWFNIQKRGSPSNQAYLASRYFNAFVEFAQFVVRVKMVNPDYYIRLMVQKNFPPEMWKLDDTFAFYLDYLVYRADSKTQIHKTVDFLTTMCDKTNCDYISLIESMEASDILFFVRQGEISPWILMNSSKMKEVFLDEDHQHEYQTLKQLIKPAYWKYRFQKEPANLALAKQMVREMGI